MKIEFESDYLLELYNDGKTKNKKYRFQPQVIKKYIKTVDSLRNAPNTEFLYKIKSLHYEKKSGNSRNGNLAANYFTSFGAGFLSPGHDLGREISPAWHDFPEHDADQWHSAQR